MISEHAFKEAIEHANTFQIPICKKSGHCDLH